MLNRRAFQLFPAALNRRPLLLCGIFIIALVILERLSLSPPLKQKIPLNLTDSVLRADNGPKKEPKEQNANAAVPPHFEYTIQPGDTLSGIFKSLGFPYHDLMSMMKTDLDHLALDTLLPGNRLKFWKNEKNQLSQMTLQFSTAKKVIYRRNADQSFTFSKVTIPGVWKSQTVSGQIQTSLREFLKQLKVSANELHQIADLLKDKINFNRDLRQGDRFEMVRRVQSVDGVETGESEIVAIKIHNRGREIAAYLHHDGQFYDAQGHSLQHAFQRYPLAKKWRISDSFNPRRRHPVTHRIQPHNGTDFATPTGTQVLATADGVVVRTPNHPYAGRYITLKHSSKYTTRYLHLSKILVKKGQRVHRGQVIGLTGRSGRVTGPHLHYELIENGHAVDAMKAEIPMAESISKKEMHRFAQQRDQLDRLLKTHRQS